ncbi:hypothetical protein D081_1959 [Anaerovibrio sp. JC8]|nr:hypothetical protein D081_1959 [Anaerovibrio sp. JC8]
MLSARICLRRFEIMDNDKYWQPLTIDERNNYEVDTFVDILQVLGKKNAYDVIGGNPSDSPEVLKQKATDLKNKYKGARNDINKAVNKIRIIFNDDASKAAYDSYLNKKFRLRLFGEIDKDHERIGVITFDSSEQYSKTLSNLVDKTPEECLSIIHDYCNEKNYKVDKKRVIYVSKWERIKKKATLASYVAIAGILAFTYFFVLNTNETKDSIIKYSQISKDEVQINDELSATEFIEKYNSSIGANSKFQLSAPEAGISNEHDTYWYKAGFSDKDSGVGIYTNKNGLLTKLVVYLPPGYNQSDASMIFSNILNVISNNKVENGLILAVSNAARFSRVDMSPTNFASYLRAYYLMMRERDYTVCLRSMGNNRDYVIKNTDQFIRKQNGVKIEISARGMKK